MFSLGLFEVVILFSLALIFLGPKRLPKLAKETARFIHHLRSVKEDVHRTISSSPKDSSDKK